MNTYVKLLWRYCSNTSCRTSWRAPTNLRRSSPSYRVPLRPHLSLLLHRDQVPGPGRLLIPIFALSEIGLEHCFPSRPDPVPDLDLSGSNTCCDRRDLASSSGVYQAVPRLRDPLDFESGIPATRIVCRMKLRNSVRRTASSWSWTSIWRNSRGRCRSSPCRTRVRWSEAVF